MEKRKKPNLDISPLMWLEYLETKNHLRKIERKYYGWFNRKFKNNYNTTKKLSKEDLQTLIEIDESLTNLNNYCVNHNKIMLNGAVVSLKLEYYRFRESMN